MYHLESETQHPLMSASNALLHASANFASHLGDDLRATIEQAAVEKDLVDGEVARLQDQLTACGAGAWSTRFPGPV